MAIKGEWIDYDGHRGYFAAPERAAEPLPAIIVIQEIYGVNGHIEDVTRRFASAGYAALAPDPKALLLDEPTTGLDLVARQHFLTMLQEIARQGKTILLVTHHIEEVLPEIQRVILLREGRVFLEGPKEEVLTTGNLSALYGAKVVVRQHGGYYSAQCEGG